MPRSSARSSSSSSSGVLARNVAHCARSKTSSWSAIPQIVAGRRLWSRIWPAKYETVPFRVWEGDLRARLRNPEFVHQRRWFTLLVLCVSLIVIVLDNTILNVALPTLAHPTANGGLGATGSQLQWMVDSYTIVFAGLLLTAGSLGDRFGRYKALTFGLSVFGIGSLLSAFATDADVLIATRALMGVGGAFIMPS